jgi:hypothetical protein
MPTNIYGQTNGAGSEYSQYFNPIVTFGGQPVRPNYQPAFDPYTMSMFPWAQGAVPGETDKQGINKYREEALRSGPSAWAGLSNQKQDMEGERAREKLAGETASRQADAESALAMRGGLDSGARERLASSGMKDYLSGSQGIAQQGMTNKLQVSLNDEQNRISQLGALPGMENTARQGDFQRAAMLGQAKEGDIRNQMNDNLGRNAFNMAGYDAAMRSWAANQQANATANSGKK